MKRTYTKPLFYVEAYTFNESVASNPDCGIDIDTIKDPLTVVAGKGSDGTVLCPTDDGGHRWDPTNKQATLVTKCKETDTVITLFNDGMGQGGCEYDYDARNDIIAQTGDKFSMSLFGTGSDYKNHAPAWDGMTFRS